MLRICTLSARLALVVGHHVPRLALRRRHASLWLDCPATAIRLHLFGPGHLVRAQCLGSSCYTCCSTTAPARSNHGTAGPEHAHGARRSAPTGWRASRRSCSTRCTTSRTSCAPTAARWGSRPTRSRRPTARRSRTARGRTSSHSNEDHETATSSSTCKSAPDDVKAQVNRYRVCACLVAYVLIFIKHIPRASPTSLRASCCATSGTRSCGRVQPAAPVEAQEDQAAHDARPLRDRERRL